MMTEEQKKALLESEEFIASIIKIRQPQDAKKWWESPFLTSLVTVIVTATLTIGGGYVAQTSTKNQEIKIARLEQHRNKKQEFLATMYDLLAKTIKSSDDRLDLAKGILDDLPKKQLDITTEETNFADDNWRSKCDSTELFVYLYYGDQPTIIEGWNNVTSSINKYCECAENAYIKNKNGNKAPKTTCNEEMAKAKKALGNFRDTLTKQYTQEIFGTSLEKPSALLEY